MLTNMMSYRKPLIMYVGNCFFLDAVSGFSGLRLFSEQTFMVNLVLP